jgi:hypothetical protein
MDMLRANCRHLIAAAMWVSCSLVWPQAASQITQQPTADDDELVGVVQVVTTAYEASPATLKQMLDASLEVRLTVQPRDTLSGVIAKTYGVGKSTAPLTYSTLERQILERNGVGSERKIKAGQDLVLPDVPRIALSEPNSANPLNQIPKLSTLRNASAAIPPPRDTYVGLPKASDVALSDTGRAGSAEVIQIRYITRREARRRVENLQLQANQISDVSIDIVFSQAQPDASLVGLDLPDLDIVKAQLLSPRRKPSMVLILDDGWPDKDEFVNSKRFLLKAIGEIRGRCQMGPSAVPESVVSATELTLARLGIAGKPGRHASMIKRAIGPLRTLDRRAEGVDVVYIPLFTAQSGSAEILREIFEINFIAKATKGRCEDPVPQDIRTAARESARTVLKKLDQARDLDLLQSNQLVLESVHRFARILTDQRGGVFFLNMSWTTPNFEFEPYLSPDAYGIGVVAAGNDGDSVGTTVYQTKRQFVLRSKLPGDFIGVMNIDANGRSTCNSSLLEVDSSVYGVAFPGSISSTECGTSFSAPRVAWLLAARESLRPRNARVDIWLTDLQKEIRMHRDPEASGFNRIRLNVKKLFQQTVN